MFHVSSKRAKDNVDKSEGLAPADSRGAKIVARDETRFTVKVYNPIHAGGYFTVGREAVGHKSVSENSPDRVHTTSMFDVDIDFEIAKRSEEPHSVTGPRGALHVIFERYDDTTVHIL